jgi:hypothetical protein
MELQKSTTSTSLNQDNDLKNYLIEKKEENLALKKLLHALENAKNKRKVK